MSNSSEKRRKRDALKRKRDEALQEQAAVRGSQPQAMHGSFVRAQYSEMQGPLPPPSILAGYDEVHPGLAERIVRLAEDEAAHRRGLQTKVVDHNLVYESRAQRFALAAMLSIVGLAALMACLDRADAGAWVAGTVVVGVIAAFIGNRVVAGTKPTP